ncbi:CoA transferase, partial [Desertimonas flava]|uniref:CoA transferase n=1 Tax=Desertimonas flava TaxID=2064846 RepID=UPI003C6C3EA4
MAEQRDPLREDGRRPRHRRPRRRRAAPRLADVRAEYAGLLLAGLGADVIKVEPPQGNPTRRIGPFYADEPGPERSLHFW